MQFATIIKRLKQEVAMASNIKSKQNREQNISNLKLALTKIGEQKEMPETGYALFLGPPQSYI